MCIIIFIKVDSADKPNKNETYEQILQILEPEINKLREFMNFQVSGVHMCVFL